MYRRQHKIIVMAVLAASMALIRDRVVQAVVFAALLGACAYVLSRQREYSVFAMHMVSHDDMNESLIVEGRVAGRDALLLIDTGYAGPPVLSASYLSVSDPCTEAVGARFAAVMKTLEGGVSADAQHRAIDQFIAGSGCMSYTSGCTMRLMGIGSVKEQQADMLMCEMLQLRTPSGWYGTPKRSASDAHADVFVTNPLPTSVHILTCDFLLHSSPALLQTRDGRLHLNMNPADALFHKMRMTMHPVRFSGGAFVVDVTVGGVPFRCTIDSGSPGPICLSATAAKRLTGCTRSAPARALRQTGVNGERVCSDVVRSDVVFANSAYADVPVLANDTGMGESVDGYIGMGVLRAFDIFVSQDGIGFRANGLPMVPYERYIELGSARACEKTSVACEA